VFGSKGISVSFIKECNNLCRQTNCCGMVLEKAKYNFIDNNL